MYNNATIQSIRILPNDKSTFPTEEEFKEFVEGAMCERGGYYYFTNSMMNCPANTLVLFQYAGKIRATGLLIDSERKAVINEQGEKYSGYYQFDVDTLHYLCSPIEKEDVQKIIPSFKGFNQSKQKIDLEYNDAIHMILAKKDDFYVQGKGDINDPVSPKALSSDGTRYICPRCLFDFIKALRCPECGQLIKE